MKIILLTLAKIYLVGAVFVGLVLPILLKNNKFYLTYIAYHKKMLEDSLDDETKMAANMINFNIEDHLEILVLDQVLTSWLAIPHIIHILKISKKQ